jgi:hypothetical protein
METPASAARYQVLSEIGAGGMGRVWRAKDLRLSREVALKRLLPSLASDAVAVERFLREARIAAALSHPNAVHVYDVDQDEQGPFIAMELVRGQSLGELLKSKGALSPRDAVRMVRQVGEALAAAHAAGILHRDVKPSNVLVDEQGIPRLTDFGIALFEGKGELTRSLVGTPEYMAPEQTVAGGKVDARADVYALAATLYACLTGEAPRMIRESRIPQALRPAMLKALAQSSDERFNSVDAFLKALEAATGARAQKARMLYRLKWIGAAGAVASVVSVLVALSRFAPHHESTSRVTFPEPRVLTPATPPPIANGEVVAKPPVVAAFERVQVLPDRAGAGYALGFIENKGETPLEHAHIEMKFFDDKGALVLGATGFASADRIEPGARFPASVLLKPFPAFARYEASVNGEQYGYTEPSVKLEVLEKKLEPARFSGYELFAKVRNADTVAASYPRVTAVLFDSKDRIVGIHDGYLAAHSLAPGEASTASTQVMTLSDEAPARFELFLFGGRNR